jgi:hypothetical protein
MAKDTPAVSTQERPDIVTLASETLMGDIRDFLLDRLKRDHNPLPWQMRPEKDQQETIDQATAAARHWVSRAVSMIAARGQQAARGSMVKFQSKDGIQMQINIAASDPLRHKLMDHVGGTVLVIIADAEQYQGERSTPKVSKDQRDILDDEPHDED